jgi:hypothetical protein
MAMRANESGMRTSRTVFSVFPDREDAAAAIRALQRAGFADDGIGVALRDRNEQNEFVSDTGTEAADGAATGAVSGGVIGGLVGLLGSLLVPGLGPIVVGGVLASTLTGAAAGAATGGIIGGLIGAGATEQEAGYFDERIRSGDVLVTVDAGARADEARAILAEHRADLGPTAVSRGTAVDGEAAGRRFLDDEDSMGAAIVEETIAGSAGSAWSGEERRRWNDPAFAGPERRRMAGV